MNIKYHIITLTLLFICLMTASASTQQATAEPTLNQEQMALKQALNDQPSWIKTVYQSKNYRMQWSDSDQPNSNFTDLIKTIKKADQWALVPQNYPIDALQKMASQSNTEREIFTTRVYLRFLHDLVSGRTTPMIDYSDEFAEERLMDKGALIQTAFNSGDIMRFLKNATTDNILVQQLTQTLKKYRSYLQEKPWQTLTMSGNKLEEGMQDSAVTAIRKRLQAEGFLSPTEESKNPELFDPAMTQAIEDFQSSRSMLVDGIIGEDTIKALNEPLSDLVKKLEINIERARWLPKTLGKKAILVNIADYQLHLYEQDQLYQSINVVVGTDRNETPVFAENMSRVVINPYWNIPRSIVRNELAVKMLEDPEYLQSKQIEVLSGWEENPEVLDDSEVDWEAASKGDFSFRLRQKPGKDNSLGLIKFLFPNEHDVYLHDTPAEALFDKDKRAFSHGCIRVEDPIALADFVFNHTDEWDADKVQAQIDSKEQMTIELAQEIPVYITYFTAWTDVNGQVKFSRDIYDRDQALIHKLER